MREDVVVEVAYYQIWQVRPLLSFPPDHFTTESTETAPPSPVMAHTLFALYFFLAAPRTTADFL